ncbi:uncharacterized protein Z519_02170 [Cladophialophora bantiana CBS 173.52]|uniref:Fe2OG dioxygenase domain-containing protein n=1 Tax=Cladophialophora bantiana (strain ATCC 10958 / CBS 173.52 / CDC B-1940 / NIH 8579) TaxID=1442370 RepID=A0A0D2IJ26_CLAB1|nr:uncharacterized protein Z519_02170 [Cladophialophora bantiana CBS 173.52]KIW96779.1 hypothetical protein Z519_02170 [Cladophialophora bantiana CBS 173.52]
MAQGTILPAFQKLPEADTVWENYNKPGGKFGLLDRSKEVPGIKGDFDAIPIIDIGGIFSDDLQVRKAVAVKLLDACTRIGFFYIKNHGVPQEMVDGVFDWAEKFFQMPLDDKMEFFVTNSHNLRGYTPPESSGRLDKDGRGNRNEHWEWGHDSKLNDDPDEKYLCPHMNGENRWPSKLPGFEEHLSTYYRTLRDLARKLTRNLALAVGLSEAFFDPLMTHPGCTAALVRYPPQPSHSFDYGIRPHTDVEFLTILSPGQVPALQVLNKNGDWIEAPPYRGMFIVNVGDQLQAYTNDILVSTGHRVLNWSGVERISVPFFFSMNFEAVVEPIPELVQRALKNGDPVSDHPSTTAGEMYKSMKVIYHRHTNEVPKYKKWVKNNNVVEATA